jgi:hypothetical protein
MTGHAKLLQETFSSYQDKFAFCVVSTIFTPTFLFNYNMINPLHIINQLFEMQAKMKEKGIATDFERNCSIFLMKMVIWYRTQQASHIPKQEQIVKPASPVVLVQK